MLRRAGNRITFLGYPCSVAFSVLVPWQLTVDNDFYQPTPIEMVGMEGTTRPPRPREAQVESRAFEGTSSYSLIEEIDNQISITIEPDKNNKPENSDSKV